jgi:hypothetical protein
MRIVAIPAVMRDPETAAETKFALLREQLDDLAITNRPEKLKPPH